MAEKTRYVEGPDVTAEDGLRDSKGRLIDDAYVEGAIEDAQEQIRRMGRPSLSSSGRRSPELHLRLPQELDDAVREAAQQAGVSHSEWIRRALSEAVRST